jgi:hypothetical protein
VEEDGLRAAAVGQKETPDKPQMMAGSPSRLCWQKSRNGKPLRLKDG